MPDRVKTNLNKTIKSKFRFVVLNDATFEEKFSLVLSRTNVWVFLSTVAFVLIVLTASAIIYTPLKYYIPVLAIITTGVKLLPSLCERIR